MQSVALGASLVLAVVARLTLSARYRDGAGLRTLVSRFFRKTDCGSRHEVIEMAVEDAMAMEIDLALVRRLEETVTFCGKNPRDSSNGGKFVRLHIAPELAEMILNATAGCIECISNRNRQIISRLTID